MNNQMRGLVAKKAGSSTSTMALRTIPGQHIERYHRENPLVNGVDLSRNRGHQNALLAGLMTVKDEADVVISLDADLRCILDAIDRFLEKYYEGCEVVYGVRSARKTDSWFKRHSAQAFYKLMKFFGVDIVYNHADYRLMSRRVLGELAQYRGGQPFFARPGAAGGLSLRGRGIPSAASALPAHPNTPSKRC